MSRFLDEHARVCAVQLLAMVNKDLAPSNLIDLVELLSHQSDLVLDHSRLALTSVAGMPHPGQPTSEAQVKMPECIEQTLRQTAQRLFLALDNLKSLNERFTPRTGNVDAPRMLDHRDMMAKRAVEAACDGPAELAGYQP